MDGLADLDGGPMALDLHRIYGVDLADDDVWESRSWAWLRDRCYSLLDQDTFTRKAVLNGGL